MNRRSCSPAQIYQNLRTSHALEKEIAARYESADHYIISADIILRKRGGFVEKSADCFVTQKSVCVFRSKYRML